MHSDVTELRDFYARPLGQMACQLVGTRIRAKWKDVSGEVLLGLGYAAPYLTPFQDEASVLGALMPAEQGVLAWPAAGPYRAAAVDEDALPLADACVDKIIAVHSMESADSIRPWLREIWRVLRPEGRLLLVVPNRRGAWARIDTTPFGQGRPYSRGQLDKVLRANMLRPIDWASALHMPPIESRIMMRNAAAIERTGARFWSGFAGVILVEARKELVAPIARAERRGTVRELRPFRTATAAASLSAEAA